MAKIIIKSKSGWIKIKLRGGKFRSFIDALGEIMPELNTAIQSHLRPVGHVGFPSPDFNPNDGHNMRMYPGCDATPMCHATELHSPFCPHHPFNRARNDRA